jgi:hypothetical protein
MKGHDAPLLKVISLDNEVPLVISCDTKGFFKVIFYLNKSRYGIYKIFNY